MKDDNDIVPVLHHESWRIIITHILHMKTRKLLIALLALLVVSAPLTYARRELRAWLSHIAAGTVTQTPNDVCVR